MFTTAVVASHTFATEGTGLSGYFATIQSLAGFYRGPPYAFPDSHNALEDVLGLIRHWVFRRSLWLVPVPQPTRERQRQSYRTGATRLGTDQRGGAGAADPTIK